MMVFNECPVQYLLHPPAAAVENPLKILSDRVFIRGNLRGDTWVPAVESGLTVLTNERFYSAYPFREHIWVGLKDRFSFRQAVVWEGGHAAGEASSLEVPLAVLSADSAFLDSAYFSPKYTEHRVRLYGQLQPITPFFVPVGNPPTKVRGNPLPYSPQGIDSPRTFAYKMLAQQKARASYQVDRQQRAAGFSTTRSVLPPTRLCLPKIAGKSATTGKAMPRSWTYTTPRLKVEFG